MPSSAVHTFTDPGEYAAAIRATTVDLTVTGRGHFTGKRTRIDLHRLWMQRLSENMARTLHSAFVTGRAIVTFRTHPGPSLLLQRQWHGAPAIVMRRFWRVVEENPEQPLYIPEICKAIRVPSRTLRMCCQEHLGMGPKRYLLLRRMHLARRALRRAGPDTASVTDIATRFGFWQLGRFSVQYQSLFGASPSATLRRLPE
jgi:transcriptional regulator GlxA family with amidase domain